MMKRVLSALFFAVMMAAFMFLSRAELFSESSQNSKDTTAKLIIGHTEIFGRLERSPILFDHGLHEKKLKKDGCKVCHPSAADGNLIFGYPFKIETKDKERVADAYHSKCVDCHTKLLAEGKKNGPVTCGECHLKRNEYVQVVTPSCEFDFSVHDRHLKELGNRCIFCHHSYDREDKELVYEEGTEQSCRYCHDSEKKRGPVLNAEVQAISKKGLSLRNSSHSLCLNCHLRPALKGHKAGPLECAKCHTGKRRTAAELAGVPRPDRDQPAKTSISIEGAKMKQVFFDHGDHEKNTTTCRACHHETLMACRECHNLTGKDEGGRITTADAYHDASSGFSCSGCHNSKKTDKNCLGCHYHFSDTDVKANGPKKNLCSVCHSGKREIEPAVQPILPSALNSDRIPEKVTIKILGKEYEPSVFPHRKIVKKLVEISNGNKMATSFHRNLQTICEGCHHQSDAKAQRDKPPYCRNCHAVTFDRQNLNRPRLLAAYHRQCLGCHEKMNLKQTGCKDCHEEKAAVTAGGSHVYH